MPLLPALVPALCLTATLCGQSVNDLNSLLLQANRFAAAEMAAQNDPEDLELYVVQGTGGGAPEQPLFRALDIQRWALSYRILRPERTADHHGGVIQRSVVVTCEQGAFHRLVWQTMPIMDRQSLDKAWIAASLDEAVRALNKAGFTGGFSSVTLMRTLHPRYPPGCTYIFTCLADNADVGISAQTGALLWSESRIPAR